MRVHIIYVQRALCKKHKYIVWFHCIHIALADDLTRTEKIPTRQTGVYFAESKNLINSDKAKMIFNKIYRIFSVG